MQYNQGDINQNRGHNRLNNADYGCRFAGLPKLGQAKLIADIKCNKAQSHIGEKSHLVDILHRVKTEAGNFGGTETKRAHNHAGDEKGGDIRELQVKILKNTGHHQACE